ncbi:unnamed protein product [Arctogadus glacialis]
MSPCSFPREEDACTRQEKGCSFVPDIRAKNRPHPPGLGKTGQDGHLVVGSGNAARTRISITTLKQLPDQSQHTDVVRRHWFA